tara:strand:+ start:175 stop:342 length:168 start_codon:yes stop_codon:yes gene_type:complete
MGIYKKSGANTCVGFNGSAQRKGIQGGVGGTTKTTSFATQRLYSKGDNRKALIEH